MRGGDVEAQLTGDAAQDPEAEHLARYRTRRDGSVTRPDLARLAGVRPGALADVAGGPPGGGGRPRAVPGAARLRRALPGPLGRRAAPRAARAGPRRGRARRDRALARAACCGCARRRRSRPAQRVDRVVLVAPPCPGAKVPELARFYPTGADKAAIDAASKPHQVGLLRRRRLLPRPRRGRALGRAAGAVGRPAPRRRPPQRRGRLRPVAGDGGLGAGRGRRCAASGTGAA